MNQRLRLLFTAALLAVHGVVTTAAASSAGAAAMPGLHALRRVEDTMMSSFALGEDEAAYPQRWVLQSGGSIGYSSLAASKAACRGPCPGRGQPYTGRRCQAYYQCRG